MKKPLVAISLALVLLIPASALAAPKAGASCSKAGSTSTYSGKKYTCIKSGKKLVWNKGVLIPKAIPTVSPTPTPTASPSIDSSAISVPARTSIRDAAFTFLPATESKETPKTELSKDSDFSDLAQCKLVEGVADRQGGIATGFGMAKERVVLTDNPKIQIMPVDFPNVQASNTPANDFADIQKFMDDFYGKASSKPFKFNWQYPGKYIRMAKNIEDYDVGGNFFQKTWDPKKYAKYLTQVFKTTDPFIDFTGVDAVIMITPPNTLPSQMGTFMVWGLTPGQEYIAQGEDFLTNEGRIWNILGRGGQVIDGWSYVHEFGHSLGLTDIRNVADVANQSSDGMGIFDVMASSVAPELLAWHRFLLGIIYDNQVHCVNQTQSSTHWIRPVAMQTKGLKSVVVPLSCTTGIAIESRRRMGIDNRLGKESEGVMVHTIDTKIDWPYSAFRIVPPTRSKDRTNEADSPLKIGEFVITNGIKVTVVETGSFGDVVRVENVDGKILSRPSTPCSKPTPKPSESQPTQNGGIKKDLPQPTYLTHSVTSQKITVELSVDLKALGGFVWIKQLGIEKAQSLTPKDSTGKVKIEVNVPSGQSGKNFEIFLFAYGDESESPCCSSFGIPIP